MATNIAPSAGGPNRPIDVFDAMRREMDRVFDQFGHGWPSLSPFLPAAARDVLVPSLDLKDTGKAFVISAELPGVDEKDVSLTVRDHMLTLKGEKKAEREEKGESHYLKERSYGSFERVVRLPEGADESKVEARFEKGVLTVTVEKRPEAVKEERRIEIRKE